MTGRFHIIATIGIATNSFAGQDEDGERREFTEYHDVVLWGPTAETAARYLSKGRLVFVEGRLQTRSWEHEGGTHRRTEIVASRVQFLDNAKDAQAARPQAVGAGAGGDVAPDDIPF